MRWLTFFLVLALPCMGQTQEEVWKAQERRQQEELEKDLAKHALVQEPSTNDGCILKHIVYDEGPTDVWLAYATRDGKEVRFLGTGGKDMMKAAKVCRKWLKADTKTKRSNSNIGVN